MPTADLLALRRPAPRRKAGAVIVVVSAALVIAAIALSRIDDRGARTQAVAVDAPVVHAEPTMVLETKPASRWLAEIARDAGMGLVVDPAVDGELTAAFRADTAWPQRLASLARSAGLAYELDDGVLEVRRRVSSPPRPAAAADPGPTACPQVEEEPPTPAARTLRLINARASDLAPVLSTALTGRGVSVAADQASNTLVLAGEARAIDDALRIAGNLDRPRRRFLLEARIIELTRSAREELGVRWSVAGKVGAQVDVPAADAAGESAAVTVATTGVHSIEARISALEADGRARVISRPRILVVEGAEASIESVRILRVRLPDRGAVVAGGEGEVRTGSDRAVEEIPVGVSLRVEPTLQAGGKVGLRIKAESSALGPPQPPDDIPEEFSRVVDAEVVVADGETAVLGGLLRESRTRARAGVPVLRSIPVLGLLFGKRRHDRDGEELVVLVTPHLLS